MFIFLTMLLIGLLLGFVGAGGSGFIISILTIFFNIPIHIALGTSLVAMVFTSLSGAYSHYREKNVVIKIGLVMGLFGGIGAFSGSHIAYIIPDQNLKWLTASMLLFSALLLWIRIFTRLGKLWENKETIINFYSFRFWIIAGVVGLVTGMLSGVFGIGSAAFIQISLLVFFGLSIQQSAGTTLFIILPISFVGGFGYYILGNFDIQLFSKVALGTVIGTFIGAKFTNRFNPFILKTAMVVVPAIGGLILLFGK